MLHRLSLFSKEMVTAETAQVRLVSETLSVKLLAGTRCRECYPIAHRGPCLRFTLPDAAPGEGAACIDEVVAPVGKLCSK